jgi:prefoldin beta subunit
MDLDNKKIQEMQVLEQNLQNVLLQKQAFQMESTETDAALKELESAGDEVFKVIGQLMIKSDKKKMQDELANKKKLLDMRMTALEKQEKSISEKLEEIRAEIMKAVNKNKK